jgi:hypothetical protein
MIIIDSLGGLGLATRFKQTSGWQEFTMYRVAPKGGSVHLTFALTGLGEAWIDDVAIETLSAGESPTAAMATDIPR